MQLHKLDQGYNSSTLLHHICNRVYGAAYNSPACNVTIHPSSLPDDVCIETLTVGNCTATVDDYFTL